MITGKDDAVVSNATGTGETTGTLAASTNVPANDAPTSEQHVATTNEFGLSYAVAGSVRRLLAERPNVIAYGNIPRLKSIDRELKELGYTDPAEAAASLDRKQTPVGRSSGKPNVTAPVVEATPAATAAKAT
jgi:hypothetical protein